VNIDRAFPGDRMDLIQRTESSAAETEGCTEYMAEAGIAPYPERASATPAARPSFTVCGAGMK